MTKAELAEAIKTKALLRGSFTLRSGKKSSYYFDKYMFEACPLLLREISHRLKMLIPSGVEVLAGLEMGGIPLATALSLQTGLQTAYVRKQAKSYGTKKITEGVSLCNKKTCVIEDVITTGGQVMESVRQMRKEQAIISDVLAVLYRGKKDINPLKSEGLKLHYLFHSEDIM